MDTRTLLPQSTLPQIAREARARLLQMHWESGVGHIGGNLSCLDMLLTLYHHALAPEDEFVLSKGHAAGALYVTLWTLGRLSDDDLREFHKDGTQLSGHPAPNGLPEVLFATGSLGHGLSLAAGLALAKTLQEKPGRVFCLLSDGEWQEGSNWEALIFAVHQRLPLVLLVDANRLQGFGGTEEVAGMQALAPRLEAFGLPVTEVDGHETEALMAACAAVTAGPHAIVAHTRKGRGVSFMENKMEWHYLPMTEAQYRQAVQEVWSH